MRAVMIAVCIASLATFGSSCRFGPTGERTLHVLQANGVHARVDLHGARREGELIALRSADMLLLVDNRLVRVPYERLRHASFTRSPVTLGRSPTQRQLADLRPLSRYPLGLEEGQLRALLAALGQDEMDEVPR